MNYVREAQALEASRPMPSWADDPIANSLEWTGTSAWKENPKGGAVRIHSFTDTRIEFQPNHPSPGTGSCSSSESLALLLSIANRFLLLRLYLPHSSASASALLSGLSAVSSTSRLFSKNMSASSGKAKNSSTEALKMVQLNSR